MVNILSSGAVYSAWWCREAMQSFGKKVYAVAEDGLLLVQDGEIRCIGNVDMYSA